VRLAGRSGLSFPEHPHAPDPNVVNEARNILGSALAADDFISLSVATGEMVWEGASVVGNPISNLHEVLQNGDAHLAKQGCPSSEFFGELRLFRNGGSGSVSV